MACYESWFNGYILEFGGGVCMFYMTGLYLN